MDSTDQECGEKQCRHRPESPEQVWVLAWVVVRGMSEVSRKSPRGARVALLTRLNHVRAAQTRARICHRQNVMRAMAIVALRRLGIPESRDLPMEGIEVGAGKLLVAAAARLHDSKPETHLIYTANGMSGMAVIANWQGFGGFRDQGRVHAFFELIADSGMADAASSGHVLGVHG